ncbi:hypothetical protein Pelo_17014 [Pelomyxa schiedti]|nr:hypothetical protein Pelo_17014 [Pelomyxa schiedti]
MPSFLMGNNKAATVSSTRNKISLLGILCAGIRCESYELSLKHRNNIENENGCMLEMLIGNVESDLILIDFILRTQPGSRVKRSNIWNSMIAVTSKAPDYYTMVTAGSNLSEGTPKMPAGPKCSIASCFCIQVCLPGVSRWLIPLQKPQNDVQSLAECIRPVIFCAENALVARAELLLIPGLCESCLIAQKFLQVCVMRIESALRPDILGNQVRGNLPDRSPRFQNHLLCCHTTNYTSHRSTHFGGGLAVLTLKHYYDDNHGYMHYNNEIHAQQALNNFLDITITAHEHYYNAYTGCDHVELHSTSIFEDITGTEVYISSTGSMHPATGLVRK